MKINNPTMTVGTGLVTAVMVGLLIFMRGTIQAGEDPWTAFLRVSESSNNKCR
jgi:hypothetical protein